MIVRPYKPEDANALTRLFYDTVHGVNCRDYTPEQLAAWAPQVPDGKAWNESLLAHHTLVAEENGAILGFGDMDQAGYLDRLYVHKDHQSKGVATAICDGLEAACSANTYTTHASITAKPFFENRGYRVIKPQQVERCGVLLTNYLMKRSAIRKAGPQDAKHLAVLSLGLWPDNSANEMEREFRALTENPDVACFLAWEAHRPVGFAQCQLRRDYVEGTQTSPVGYLEGIFVTEHFRKKGIAKSLLTACEGWARTVGCSEFASDCELSNERSLQFHLHMGFREANRIICFTKKL